MGAPWRLLNPVSVGSLAGVSLVRGGVYLASQWVDMSGADVGPVFPYFPVPAWGVGWVLTGLFLLASMWRWKWFRWAISLQAAVYFTWTLLSILDLMLTPDWVSLMSIAVYGALVPITLTLARIETAPRNGELAAPGDPTTEHP